ncbi:hypothetical protein [Prolixibacter bellariivorans]|nr:hypothetical protein [Prolixibacter bellariivorans]
MVIPGGYVTFGISNQPVLDQSLGGRAVFKGCLNFDQLSGNLGEE